MKMRWHANEILMQRYSVFRTVDDYYADGEAAYDMRKPLSRDTQQKTVRANGKDVHVKPFQVW